MSSSSQPTSVQRQNEKRSSPGSGSRSAPQTPPTVESTIKKLLVSVKNLFEALTLWSQNRVDEESVSNVYVRLGNDFNAVSAAFAAHNIDMQDIASVPDDLRKVLEECLAEDRSPASLEMYMPTVREVITKLLQSLGQKQEAYRLIGAPNGAASA